MTASRPEAARLSSRRRQWILGLGAAGLLIFAGLVALLRVTTLDEAGGVRLAAAEWAMSDFKSVVYYPAHAFMKGDNPYDTETYLARHPTPFGFYLYPPVILILASPFAILPLDWAIAVKAAFTVVLAGVVALVSLRLSGSRGRLPAVLLVTALLLLSRPGQWNLLLGQVTLPVVLASYAALALAPRRPWLSACALALCLIKPNFGGPLALFMLALGYGRTVVTGGLLLVLVNLPLVAILADRAGGLTPFIEHMGGGGEPMTHVDQMHNQLNYHRVDLAILAGNLLTPFSIGVVGTVLLAGLVLALVVLALRIEKKRAGTISEASGWAGLSPATCGLIWSGVLLCGYHLTYDVLLLVWPFVAVVLEIREAGRRTTAVQWMTLGLYLVLAGNYLTTAAVLELLSPTYPLLSLMLASLNSVALLLLFCLYLYQVLKPTAGFLVKPNVQVHQPVPS